MTIFKIAPAKINHILYENMTRIIFQPVADRVLKTFINIFRGVDKYLYWRAPLKNVFSLEIVKPIRGLDWETYVGMYWILTNTLNDNQVNRFHFQLSR